jgi:hypothetical protein
MCMNFQSTLAGNDLEQEVSGVLNDFMSQNKSFTAYEVTQEVRRIVGPTVEVVHKDVRNTAHKLMGVRATQYGYEQYSRDFGSGLVAQGYRPQNVVKQGLPKSGSLPILLPVGASAMKKFAQGFNNLQVKNTAIVPADMVMEPRSEGRVTVPSSLMGKAGMYGWTKSGYVYLKEEGDKLIVTDNVTNMVHKLDKHKSFRLRKNLVKDYKKFYMTAKNGSVEIVRVK